MIYNAGPSVVEASKVYMFGYPGHSCSTVVDNSTHICKIEGLKPALGTGREKLARLNILSHNIKKIYWKKHNNHLLNCGIIFQPISGAWATKTLQGFCSKLVCLSNLVFFVIHNVRHYLTTKYVHLPYITNP